jgi:replication factor A1
MTENGNAPHVDEIARALGDKADRNKIGELLREYLETYKLPLPQAKRMVLRELGGTMPLTSGEPVNRKLGELQPNEPSVNLLARVIHLSEKEITAKGEKKRIFYGILADDTTTRPFTAWDASAFKLAKDDVVRIENAYTTEWKGEPQVNLGNRAKVTKEVDSALPRGGGRRESRELKVSDLQDGMSGVAVEARIISMDKRAVDVKGAKKTLVSGVLGDETGKVQFTAWHDFGLKAGDAVRIAGAYTKSWRGIPQLNFDERSQVSKSDAKLPAMGDFKSSAARTISDVENAGGGFDVTLNGMILEVRGGTGIIFRCAQCNRVTQNGACRIHGEVDATPDLRIKAILDDGTGTITAVFGRDVTEAMLGQTLDECLAEAKNMKVVNYDIIGKKLADLLVARPVEARGNASNDEFGLMLIGKALAIKDVEVADEARRMLAAEEGGGAE